MAASGVPAPRRTATTEMARKPSQSPVEVTTCADQSRKNCGVAKTRLWKAAHLRRCPVGAPSAVTG